MNMETQQFDHRLLRDHAFGIVAPGAELPPGIAVTPLVPRQLAPSAHLMPGLIDLRALSGDRADALLEQLHGEHRAGVQPVVGLFVKTDADAGTFARHWNARQMVAPRPGTASWLRLHDPRVLHQLLRMLTPGQRAALAGPASALRYWVAGVWMDHDFRDDMADPAPSGAMRWNWDRVERIGLINRALLAAAGDGVALHRQGALAERLMAQARERHGLQDPADLVEYATRGLRIGPEFDAHPSVAAAMRPASGDDDSSLADRLALIDDALWQDLRRMAPAGHGSE